MSAPDRLFAYGSLRAGSGHPMHDRLAAAGTFLGHGTMRGLLVAVDDARYPGLVEAEPATDVHGDVWTVHDRNLWATLDDYEGDEYVRRRRPIGLRDGGTVEAWVYLFVASWRGLPTIAGGDWLAYLGLAPP